MYRFHLGEQDGFRAWKKDANHSKYLKAMNKYYLVNGDTSKLTKEEKESIDSGKLYKDLDKILENLVGSLKSKMDEL